MAGAGALERGNRCGPAAGSMLVSVGLDPHRARELAAERMLALAEAHEHRAAERLAIYDLERERRARCPVRPGSAASPGRNPTRERTVPRHPQATRRGCVSGARRSRTGASGSGRRADRPADYPGARRSAPQAPRRARARAPRPRRARDPRASRAPGREIARACGDGEAPPEPHAGPARSAAHRDRAHARRSRPRSACAPSPTPTPGVTPSRRREIVRRYRQAASSLERIHRLRIILHRCRNRIVLPTIAKIMACLIILVNVSKPRLWPPVRRVKPRSRGPGSRRAANRQRNAR